MKRNLLIALVLAGAALAANSYWDTCTEAACYPFNSSNSYVRQKAANLAAANNAAVGDDITLIDTNGNQFCEEKSLEWEVNHAPVLSSADLTFEDSYCMAGGGQ